MKQINASAVKVNNLGKFCALLALLESPAHGYELMKKVGERAGGRASPGQVYPFLKLLQKNGLVVSRKAGSREKTTYSLTQKGKQFASKIIERMGNLLDAALKTKLTKCAHCECEIYRGGVKARKGGREKMFCCGACAGSC